jgi:2-amino-4-hydroxy-6-hydroxymethyldihydropteridine diphosphokinase
LIAMEISPPHLIIALGANLAGRFGPPRAALGAALERLEAAGVAVTGRSPWYETAPVPVSDQPWYVNGVATVATGLGPEALLALMLETELEMGRERSVQNAARVVDLDLLAYGDMVRKPPAAAPELPHPRLAERAFVVLPLADLLPGWRHPESGLSPREMVQALPGGQQIRPLADADGLYGTEWLRI